MPIGDKVGMSLLWTEPFRGYVQANRILLNWKFFLLTLLASGFAMAFSRLLPPSFGIYCFGIGGLILGVLLVQLGNVALTVFFRRAYVNIDDHRILVRRQGKTEEFNYSAIKTLGYESNGKFGYGVFSIIFSGNSRPLSFLCAEAVTLSALRNAIPGALEVRTDLKRTDFEQSG